MRTATLLLLLITLLYSEQDDSLYQAVYNRDLSEATRLIDNGHDVNNRNSNTQRTPLFAIDCYTSDTYHEESLIALLVSNGADINARDKYGNTPLHAVLDNSYSTYDRTKVLLEHGADISLLNDRNSSPLYIASTSRSSETITLLIENGADIIEPNSVGRTPMHRAALFSNIEAMVTLHKFGGTTLNAQEDSLGRIPLFYALKSYKVGSIPYFIDILSTDAPVHSVDIENRTLLDIYMENEHLERGTETITKTIKQLIEIGVSPTSSRRPTPYQVAFIKRENKNLAFQKEHWEAICTSFESSGYDFSAERKEIALNKRAKVTGAIKRYIVENKISFSLFLIYFILSFTVREIIYKGNRDKNPLRTWNNILFCTVTSVVLIIAAIIGIGLLPDMHGLLYLFLMRVIWIPFLILLFTILGFLFANSKFIKKDIFVFYYGAPLALLMALLLGTLWVIGSM